MTAGRKTVLFSGRTLWKENYKQVGDPRTCVPPTRRLGNIRHI